MSSTRKRPFNVMLGDETKKNESKVPRKKQKIDRLYPICLCGDPLTPLKAWYIYDGTVSCNGGCKRWICGDEIIWHCNKEEIDEHSFGFDICDKCIKNVFTNLFKTKIYKNISDINN